VSDNPLYAGPGPENRLVGYAGDEPLDPRLAGPGNALIAAYLARGGDRMAGNAVGTERVPAAQLTRPDPGVDPVAIDVDGHPVLGSELRRIQQTSANIRDSMFLAGHTLPNGVPVIPKQSAQVIAESLKDRISTRVPTSVGAPDVHGTPHLTINTDAMREVPESFQKNMELLRGYPGLRIEPGSSPDEVARQFLDHARDNVLALHDAVPPQIRQRSKLWYDGANVLAGTNAETANLPLRSAAGSIAALSPGMDWFKNVSLHDRVLDTFLNHQDTRTTSEMLALGKKFIEEKIAGGTPKALKGAAILREALGNMEGRKFGDLPQDGVSQALWTRLHDVAHRDPGYNILTPEGTIAGRAVNLDRTPSTVTWAALPDIEKSLSSLRDPSLRNISAQMGLAHKVRNFYNNIAAPNATFGDVTADTHAIAGALLRPLGQSADEVAHGLGGAGSGSSISGANGIYGLHADAIREAAAMRDLLPREMQSISWEAMRGLFSPAQKTNKGMKEWTNQLAEQYRNGTIDIGEYRDAISDVARGINAPSWAGRGVPTYSFPRVAPRP
jgi:hypothetical protein